MTMPLHTEPLLSVDSIRAGYGDFQALFEPSLHVDSGETVAIIGANGAGKSTLLRAVAGQVRVTGGSMTYRGTDLGPISAHKRVGLGISLVPEGRRLFPSLSVQENLVIGGHRARDGKWNLESVLELFPLIRPLLKRAAGTLSGGEQQATAIGRALMANPELLLLDEVSLGLAPVVVKDIYSALPGIVESGTTVVLVEQDITLALGAANRVYCMLEGRVSLSGAAGQLSHEAITTAYFGVD
jgi:branched-chain amino acid transport system ATP-binding protein